MSATMVSKQVRDAEFTLAAFRPKKRLSLELGGWRVRTVDTSERLERTFRMRAEALLEERIGRPSGGLDEVDEFDLFSDHLVVEEPSKGEIVAAYRLISSTFSTRFYSQEEFHVGGFLREPGVKLELSRACVKPEFRTGVAITLMWKGIARYAELVGARYLFGSCPVWSSDPAVAFGLLESLGEQRRSVSFGVHPGPAFRFPCRPAPGTGVRGAKAREYLPSLMRAYLNAGAKVQGDPAFDRHWNCSDYFLTLDFLRVAPRVRARMSSQA